MPLDQVQIRQLNPQEKLVFSKLIFSLDPYNVLIGDERWSYYDVYPENQSADFIAQNILSSDPNILKILLNPIDENDCLELEVYVCKE